MNIGRASVDGLPTGGTSKPAVASVDVPDNRRHNIGRCPLKSAYGRPMICRLLADYKESAAGRLQKVGRLQRSSLDASPTSGRCPADLYTTGCRLMSPHIGLASFSHLWSVWPPRPIRSKVSRLCMTGGVELIIKTHVKTKTLGFIGDIISLWITTTFLSHNSLKDIFER